MKPPHGFIPGTREVEIARGIVYRPIMSWHAGNLAGAGVEEVSGDRSGCLEMVNGRPMTSQPKSVVQRIYWHPKRPDVCVSAFLSYPNGLGACPQFFWEAYGGGLGEPQRFLTEELMEDRIVATLAKQARTEKGVRKAPRKRAKSQRR